MGKTLETVDLVKEDYIARIDNEESIRTISKIGKNFEYKRVDKKSGRILVKKGILSDELEETYFEKNIKRIANLEKWEIVDS